MIYNVKIERNFTVEIPDDVEFAFEELDKAIDEGLQPMNDLVPEGYEPENCDDEWEIR